MAENSAQPIVRPNIIKQMKERQEVGPTDIHRMSVVDPLTLLMVEPRGRVRSRQGVVPDATVFQRYEYKYAIAPELVEPICSFIRPYCEMDRFAAREEENFYTVTSLYLDTDGYRTYWDKRRGSPIRFKLRVRTYAEYGDGPVKFEIKRSFNQVSRKTRVNVPRETWPDLLTGPVNGSVAELSKPERAALDDFIRVTRTFGARPKMLVRYQRQAFTSRIDRYVRITFDRRLVYLPTSNYDLTGGASNWHSIDDPATLGEPGSRVLLELKFMSGAPIWLFDLVRTFRLVRRGFSKYCSAVSRTMDAEQTGKELSLAMPLMGIRRRNG
ncbi:MAG: polyphosphate polymerase domain-containing protein [Acidobacteria bacterium]|nr:polyphosphate polymerase domain-containing protein [Acidobacteriota bacterium]